jgi:hypoxanthine-guanine phosphoribosyltransferase
VPTPLDDVADILLSSEAIAAKVHELGQLVAEAYQGADLLLVSVLKGAVVFLSDLRRASPPVCASVPCWIARCGASSSCRWPSGGLTSPTGLS